MEGPLKSVTYRIVAGGILHSLESETNTVFPSLSLIGLDHVGKGGAHRHDNREDCFVCVRDKAKSLSVLKMMRVLRGDKQAVDREGMRER